MAKTDTPTTPPAAGFDPMSWTINTERKAPKRNRETGIDRTPFYGLLKALQVGQVVEIPTALTDKEAKSAQNIVRESAKDLDLAVTFLVDIERNDANKHADGTNFYAWFVKGAYKARGPRQTVATA